MAAYLGGGVYSVSRPERMVEAPGGAWMGLDGKERGVWDTLSEGGGGDSGPPPHDGRWAVNLITTSTNTMGRRQRQKGKKNKPEQQKKNRGTDSIPKGPRWRGLGLRSTGGIGALLPGPFVTNPRGDRFFKTDLTFLGGRWGPLFWTKRKRVQKNLARANVKIF